MGSFLFIWWVCMVEKSWEVGSWFWDGKLEKLCRIFMTSLNVIDFHRDFSYISQIHGSSIKNFPCRSLKIFSNFQIFPVHLETKIIYLSLALFQKLSQILKISRISLLIASNLSHNSTKIHKISIQTIKFLIASKNSNWLKSLINDQKIKWFKIPNQPAFQVH